MNQKLNMLLCIAIAIIFLIPPVNAADVSYDESSGAEQEVEQDMGSPGTDQVLPEQSHNDEEEETGDDGSDDLVNTGEVTTENSIRFINEADPAADRRREDSGDDTPESEELDEELSNPVDTDAEVKGAAMTIDKVTLHYSNDTPTSTMDHGHDGKISAKETASSLKKGEMLSLKWCG